MTLEVNFKSHILEPHIDRNSSSHRESHSHLASIEIAWGISISARDRSSNECPKVWHHPVCQRPKENMSNHPIYRIVFWKIQDINEIIPPGIQIQRMLVCNKCGGMLTIVLINSSHLKVAVAKGSESSLGSNDPGLWRECSLIKRDVKTKWTKRQKVWNRLYR